MDYRITTEMYWIANEILFKGSFIQILPNITLVLLWAILPKTLYILNEFHRNMNPEILKNVEEGALIILRRVDFALYILGYFPIYFVLYFHNLSDFSYDH